MTTLSQESARLDRRERQGLELIFDPICPDLRAVEEHLADRLGGVRDAGIRKLIEFLLGSPGKRIRPALVLLSTGAAADVADDCSAPGHVAVAVATAVELIHMASLVHDDLIDGAAMRHRRASVNARWGRGAAVALGDYLCSHAMAMVGECGDPRVFAILGSQLSAMCEGELLQVAGRANFALSERHCLAVTEKKTAALFGACCEAGALAGGGDPRVCNALRRFGVCLGMAFQILDDCRDLLSDEEDLGKKPGQDLLAGDVTLPLLYGIRHCRLRSGKQAPLVPAAMERAELMFIRDAFHASQSPVRIRRMIESYIGQARMQLSAVRDSDFSSGLHGLTGYIAVSMSDILRR